MVPPPCCRSQETVLTFICHPFWWDSWAPVRKGCGPLYMLWSLWDACHHAITHMFFSVCSVQDTYLNQMFLSNSISEVLHLMEKRSNYLRCSHSYYHQSRDSAQVSWPHSAWPPCCLSRWFRHTSERSKGQFAGSGSQTSGKRYALLYNLT